MQPYYRAAILRDVARSAQWRYQSAMLTTIILWWVRQGYDIDEVSQIVREGHQNDHNHTAAA